MEQLRKLVSVDDVGGDRFTDALERTRSAGLPPRDRIAVLSDQVPRSLADISFQVNRTCATADVDCQSFCPSLIPEDTIGDIDSHIMPEWTDHNMPGGGLYTLDTWEESQLQGREVSEIFDVVEQWPKVAFQESTQEFAKAVEE